MPRIAADAVPAAALGPTASALLYLPTALWLAAVLAAHVEHHLDWSLRLLARASVWLLLVLSIIDPAWTLSDQLRDRLGDGLGVAFEGIRAVTLGR